MLRPSMHAFHGASGTCKCGHQPGNSGCSGLPQGLCVTNQDTRPRPVEMMWEAAQRAHPVSVLEGETVGHGEAFQHAGGEAVR